MYAASIPKYLSEFAKKMFFTELVFFSELEKSTTLEGVTLIEPRHEIPAFCISKNKDADQ